MTAVYVALPRVLKAESYRQFPYDDATGERVKAPQGNLTWLYGLNLDTEGSPELGELLATRKLQRLHTQLMAYPWYAAAGDVRASAPLEIAFNGGLGDILHYPHMIAAYGRQDWPEASAQCTAADPRLKGRYDHLAQIILTGVSP